MSVRQMNIKNRTHYFYNDLINVKHFDAKNLNLGLDIYYIAYVDKKPEWNVDSVNPLYLIIKRIDRLIEEKNRDKYLNINNTDRNSEALKKIQKFEMELKIASKNKC